MITNRLQALYLQLLRDLMECQRLKSSQDYELVNPVHYNTPISGSAPNAFWDDLGYHSTTEGRNVGRWASHIGEKCLFNCAAFIFREMLIITIIWSASNGIDIVQRLIC